MEAFPGISHEDLLKLVFSIAVLLGVARLLGEAARRLRQPPVVGEILAGVLLGPSILSALSPRFGSWLLPETAIQAQLLDGVALIGILFLMIVVGLETDLGLIRTRWRVAAGVGIGGLIVPFGLGLAMGWFVPATLVAGEGKLVFALFLAVALALSAIPVLAKILSDLGLLRREFGQTALAAGMIDDICGWGLLGIVISLASSGSLTWSAGLATVGAIVFFFAATVLVARPAVQWGMAVVSENFTSRDMILTLVVVFSFGWGAFSQWLHLEPILGAFAIGVLFGQIRQMPVDVVQKLESITNGVLAPIFLATAGLRLRIDVLLEPELLAWTLALFLVAAAGKLGGGYLGGRFLARTSGRDALGYGIALNARGVLGIIVATIGLTMGIFGVEIYSMIVVTSVLTSVLAPVGLRLIFDVREEEEDLSERLVFRRALLPVRVRDESGDDVRKLEASVLGTVCEPGASVTVLSVVEADRSAGAEAYVRQVADLLPDTLLVRRRVVKGDDPKDVILDVASRGYDLLAIGAPEPAPDQDFLFGPMIDDLVRLAPCPSMVFTARDSEWPPRTVLVPTGGGAPAASAARVAFEIAGPEATVILLHVIDPDTATETGLGRQSSTTIRMSIAEDILSDLRRIGEMQGVKVATEVVMRGATTANIIERARHGVDLMVNQRTGRHHTPLSGSPGRAHRQRGALLAPDFQHLIQTYHAVAWWLYLVRE